METWERTCAASEDDDERPRTRSAVRFSDPSDEKVVIFADGERRRASDAPLLDEVKAQLAESREAPDLPPIGRGQPPGEDI